MISCEELLPDAIPVILRILLILVFLGFAGFYGWTNGVWVKGLRGWIANVEYAKTMTVDPVNPNWTPSRPGSEYGYHHIQYGHDRWMFWYGLGWSVVCTFLLILVGNITYCAL